MLTLLYSLPGRGHARQCMGVSAASSGPWVETTNKCTSPHPATEQSWQYYQEVLGRLWQMEEMGRPSSRSCSIPNLGSPLCALPPTSGWSTESKAAVEEAVNAVSWVQQLSDNQPVSTSPFIKTTLSGLQRILAKPKKCKEPITAAILARMVSSLGQAPSLSDVQLVASSLLAYAGFLRYNEVARLCCCDVQIGPDSMSIHVTSSKTDQLRQGDHVLISRTNTPTCPVAMMERYIQAAGISLASKLRLFRAITSTKKGERLRAGGSLSYTRMHELLLKKLTDLGYDKSCFSLHSLRAGGATAAANAGVPDRLFKRHGRWKSESAKDGYVKDSVDALLSVSKNLDL